MKVSISRICALSSISRLSYLKPSSRNSLRGEGGCGRYGADTRRVSDMGRVAAQHESSASYLKALNPHGQHHAHHASLHDPLSLQAPRIKHPPGAPALQGRVGAGHGHNLGLLGQQVVDAVRLRHGRGGGREADAWRATYFGAMQRDQQDRARSTLLLGHPHTSSSYPPGCAGAQRAAFPPAPGTCAAGAGSIPVWVGMR